MAHLYGGDLRQEIVGESNYFKALARCFKSGAKDDSGRRSFITVKLQLEDWNKHDKNAVAVVSEFGTVGYLRRDDAKLYRKLYSQSETHTTDAVVYSRDGTVFGVWIDVSLDEETAYEIMQNIRTVQAEKKAQAKASKPVSQKAKVKFEPNATPKQWKDKNSNERASSVVTIVVVTVIVFVLILSFF